MNKELRTEIVGGVLLVLALFNLLTFIYPQATGIVGEFLVNFLLWPVFGRVMYVLPLFLLAAAFLLIFKVSC